MQVRSHAVDRRRQGVNHDISDVYLFELYINVTPHDFDAGGILRRDLEPRSGGAPVISGNALETEFMTFMCEQIA